MAFELDIRGKYCNGFTKRIAETNTDKIEVLNIPEGVEEICVNAFYNVPILKKVILPKSLKIINDYAFMGSSLEEIKFQSVVRLRDGVFDRTQLKNINCNLDSIGTGVFEGCKELESVKLNGNIRDIPPYTFADCLNLKEVEMSENIYVIGCEAFFNNTSLEHIKLPKLLYTLGDSAFSYCTSLNSIDLPHDLNNIGDNAFVNCTKLKSLVIPNNTKIIGKNIVMDSGVKNITLPEDLQEMYQNIINEDTVINVPFITAERIDLSKIIKANNYCLNITDNPYNLDELISNGKSISEINRIFKSLEDSR